MKPIIDFFRKMDRRILVVLLVGIVLLMGMYFFWVSPAKSSADDILAQYESGLTELKTDQSRLAELERNGTGSVETLLAKVTALETALPYQIDDLMLAQHAANTAASTGVVLASFQAATEDASGPAGSEVTYQVYTYSVTGTFGQVSAWIDALERNPAYAIAFTSVSLTPSSGPDAGTVGDIFTGQVSASGTAYVFKSVKAPLVKTSTGTAPIPVASTPGTVPGAVPVDPNAQPSAVPVDPNAPPSAVPGVVPGAQPSAIPGAVPIQPGAQPSAVPGAVPTQPGAVPVDPNAVPAQPGAQPSAIPGAAPAQPAAQPSAVPGAIPVDPNAPPSAPVASPAPS